MPFTPVFTEADFLAAVPEEKLITSGAIAKRVKCSDPTLALYMKKLEAAEKVRRVEIVGGRDVVWQRVIDNDN